MSAPDCIPLVVISKCEFDISCILAVLFNMKPCFLDCCKVSFVVPIFETAGERSMDKMSSEKPLTF